ncbi:MAG: winged helix DNA-binding protein [Candidatus Bathyarchaeia archaeon]
MDYLLFILVSCLLATTAVSAVEYYRRLRQSKKEYEKARGAVEDIILSFNRQFRREGEKLETLAYKVGAVDSKGDRILGMMGDVEKRMSTAEAKVSADSEGRETLAVRLAEVENKTRDIVASQEAVTAKIVNLEQQARQFSAVPETSLEAAIPIRRDKALAQLTGTEVAVLEMLASEGPKTAPQIKEKVRLSREHTARLMKKLYEEGYLERETSKIPFKYSSKKEMEKLLRKPEDQAA